MGVLGWVGCGALVVLLQGWWRSGWNSMAEVTQGSSAVHWVCDRDGGVLSGLDEGALVVEECRVAWPLEQAPQQAGARWVLSAAHGPGRSGRRLQVLGGRGVQGPVLRFLDAWALGPAPQAGVRLLARTTQGLIWLQLDRNGAGERWLPAGDAVGWEDCAGTVILVGKTWVRWYPSTAGPREVRLAKEHQILAHGSNADAVWILVGSQQGPGAARLTLWNLLPGGACQRTIVLGDWRPAARAGHSLVVDADKALWVVERGGAVLRVDLRSGQRLFAKLQGPLLGASLGGSGELWALSPGGVQRLDGGAQPLPGQGGFAYLSCVVPTPGEAEGSGGLTRGR